MTVGKKLLLRINLLMEHKSREHLIVIGGRENISSKSIRGFFFTKTLSLIKAI